MERSSEAVARIELRGLRKAFGSSVAIDHISFAVEPGTIHAIVGENGAGKSTAMKILYGQYPADEGEILIGGKPVRWRSSADAIAAGFGMVHQHFMLAGSHNAVENVLLAAGGSPFGLLPLREARARLERLAKEFRLEVPLDRPIEELSVGEQQRVEILKLLYRDSKILILDEPTAVLAPSEIESLFATLRGMAASGKTILIITHKLKEVIALASRVSVFRAGRVVGERNVAGATVKDLAEMMVGHELASHGEATRKPARAEIALEVKDAKPVTRLSRLGQVSFRVHAGEVLGVAGVEGNGQSELIRMLLDPQENLSAGEIHLLNEDVSHLPASKLRALGLAVFPEDRLQQGLLLEDSVEENFLLGRAFSPKFRKGKFFLDHKALRAATIASMEAYDLRPRDPTAAAGSLSGGNQQKLVVARELSDHPRFLLAAQPTRGVDIGAVETIHERILALRDQGAGVLLLSSELDETLRLSDRLLVLYRGRVVGAFNRPDFDEKTVGFLMAGGTLERSSP